MSRFAINAAIVFVGLVFLKVTTDAGTIERGKRSWAAVGVALWPKSSDGNVYVPYQISASPAFSHNELNIIQQAISVYNTYTCIRFIPRRPTDYNYVDIQRSREQSRCSTNAVGMKGGQQIIFFASPCFHKPAAIHEFMHSLGMHHEQARIDRDQYIQIINPRVHSSQDWHKLPGDSHGTPYDLASIMQYIGLGRDWLMRRQDPVMARYVAAEQLHTLSYYDVMALTRRYSCNQKCQPVNCGQGFQAADCSCYCFSGYLDRPITKCTQQRTAWNNPFGK